MGVGSERHVDKGRLWEAENGLPASTERHRREGYGRKSSCTVDSGRHRAELRRRQVAERINGVPGVERPRDN